VAKRPEIGEALQKALAARGCALESADARRLALALLALADRGLLTSSEDHSPRPHVYNMGPSKCRPAQKGSR
jgi:hypothetical protein